MHKYIVYIFLNFKFKSVRKFQFNFELFSLAQNIFFYGIVSLNRDTLVCLIVSLISKNIVSCKPQRVADNNFVLLRRSFSMEILFKKTKFSGTVSSEYIFYGIVSLKRDT